MNRDLARGERVRAAELIGTLSLATDLGMGLPLEHGLQSTLFAMRLAERLGIDQATAWQTYYCGLLFYVGCTADADTAAEDFATDVHEYYVPAMFGSRGEVLRGLMRAMAPSGPSLVRAVRVARRLPGVVRGHEGHMTALCEVGEMLTERLGLPDEVQRLFAALNERWDGKGFPGRARGEEIPLPVRIVHVARDAAIQRAAGGAEQARRVVRERAGRAFDPEIAACLLDAFDEVLALEEGVSAWEETLEAEPEPRLSLDPEAIDRALSAIADFADLLAPFFSSHSTAVASLAAAAAELCGLDDAETVEVRRAGLVHDVGRVAVPVRVWYKPGPLTADEWEHVRLHPYHTERVLSRSPFLAALAPIAGAHHERLDGSGYHRGSHAAVLGRPARLLAAADAFQAMTEPRSYRAAHSREAAAELLAGEARAGRLDGEAVAAVLEAAEQPVPRIERPAGLTEREAEVVCLLARGLQTKQVARALGISAKTADRHVQNAYAKMGVSTRAAATLFAMQHGLVAWGDVRPERSPVAR